MMNGKIAAIITGGLLFSPSLIITNGFGVGTPTTIIASPAGRPASKKKRVKKPKSEELHANWNAAIWPSEKPKPVVAIKPPEIPAEMVAPPQAKPIILNPQLTKALSGTTMHPPPSFDAMTRIREATEARRQAALIELARQNREDEELLILLGIL